MGNRLIMKASRINRRLWTYKETIIAFAVSAILTFFFLLESPIHLWRCLPTSTDPSVFKTIALMMDKGYMPYRDSFDHKGPLLYVINYLGLKIAYYKGVWVFEAVMMTITFFMLYKIARLRAKVGSSVLISLAAASMLFAYFEEGNVTEEYAMPFIAVGIYIFLDYLLNNKISWFRIAFSSAAFGAVCSLRPNMAAVWIVFCTVIFFEKVVKKEWKPLGHFTVCFTSGFLIIVIPFIVWLAANGALKACIEDYIIFNMEYCSKSGGGVFSSRWYTFFYFAGNTVCIIAFVGILCNLKRNVFVNATYVVYMIASLVLLSMSGTAYGHYGMTLIPAVVYPMSLLMENIENLSNADIAKAGQALISVYLLCTIIIPSSIDLVRQIPSYYENRNEEQFDDGTKQVCEVVASLTSEDDSISVYGNWNIVYVWTKRKHATKYSYQFPIGAIKTEIMDDYMSQLEQELPPVVVVAYGRYDENIKSYLDKYEYSLVYPAQGEGLDYGQNNLVFYRAQD